MVNEIYFDNSATTQPLREVCEIMTRQAYENYGNPSSLHTRGSRAEKAITAARKTIAASIGAKPEEIIFTSGGTEAANLGIFGVTSTRRGKHIITTEIEHPCVLRCYEQLEKKGYETTYLPVDRTGQISVNQLCNSIREDTVLVTVMLVNNEIGSLLPVKEIGEMIRRKNPETVFLTDCVQGYCREKLKADWCDGAFFSAHKIHGPKGIGALYLRKGIRMGAHMFGGGQEKGLRSGTENVPAIAGFAKAVELLLARREENETGMRQVKQTLRKGLLSMEDVYENSPQEGVSHILNCSFLGVRSETLLHFLEDRGIFVSSGSACSSHKPNPSHVLTAIGLPREPVDSAVRFSFCGDNTVHQAEECIKALREIVPVLRQMGKGL